ncbi:hypothetical protein GmHk_10G029421 [Glycine max]|nr:hypothetical protein GmHk_10G029421 [Glycine max]
MVTCRGCKINMFHNIFGMRKKIENYTLDKLSPPIKVKNKYQTKLFLYFDNLRLDRKMEARNTYFSTFHMRCGVCICVDESPLIGPTNLNWADLCEELSGLYQKKVNFKHFPQLNNHDDNLQVERFTHAWILRFIGEMCNVINYKIKSIGCMCVLIQMWLRRENQHIGNDDLILFRRKLDIMKRHERHYSTVSPQGRNTWTVDDLVPYVEKITILSEEQERIIEPLSHGPATEHEFTVQEFNILQSRHSQTKGEAVEAEPYLYPQMVELSDTDVSVSIRSSPSDTSSSDHSLGGVAETYPNFSWPTMTYSQQHDASIPTPNAPLGTQWNVPGVIPNIDELLGIDLRHQFSAEADQVEEGRQARRWERPCGTSSRHHRHHDD